MKIKIEREKFDTDGRDLCCRVNPSVYRTDLYHIVYKECCYCHKPICETCIDKYTNEDYYHHRRCVKECPHTEVYHNEDD